jgi:hypothetical protein
MLPLPMMPSPPALLTALAKRHPLAQIIPACIMGSSMPNNFVMELEKCMAKSFVMSTQSNQPK